MRFGILGAAWIAERALIPAFAAAANAELVAIASRNPDRARELAPSARVMGDYGTLLEDPDVDAVYIPLVNSLHLDWTLRALEAGKHVLCEKPLAMDATEAEAMASAAVASRRLLMEAFMYRFHPRIRETVAHLQADPPDEIYVSFGFRLDDETNYRAIPELGGGALYDVGCYCVSLARWIYGEPASVRAAATIDRVDRSVEAELEFGGGRRARLFASIASDEVQELRWPGGSLDQPFTAWRDPWDSYQLMVEAFSDAVLRGDAVAPLPVEDSIANLRVLDRVRAAFAG